MNLDYVLFVFLFFVFLQLVVVLVGLFHTILMVQILLRVVDFYYTFVSTDGIPDDSLSCSVCSGIYMSWCISTIGAILE